MREMILSSFEKLVWALVIIIMLGAVLGGIGTMLSPAEGGFFVGLLILIGGLIYAVIIGGVMFLFIGIHENTKRTAEALERINTLG